MQRYYWAINTSDLDTGWCHVWLEARVLLVLLWCLADAHWRIRTRIPYTAIRDRDPTLNLCNVKFRRGTIVAIGKLLRIRVRICVYEQAITPSSRLVKCIALPYIQGEPNCLEGLTFVITGVLESLERDEAKSLLERYGGKVTGNISKKTNYLVLGRDGGESKTSKVLSTTIIYCSLGILKLLCNNCGTVEPLSTVAARESHWPGRPLAMEVIAMIPVLANDEHGNIFVSKHKHVLKSII